MLNANDFRTELISALAGIDNATDAMNLFSTAVTNYILNNAEFSFAWVAIDGGGTPDPVTSATGAFITGSITFTPSFQSSKGPALTAIQQQYNSGLANFSYNITDSGFATTPAFVGSVIGLNLNIPITNNQETALLALCNNIIDNVKGQLYANTVSGTRGIYTGVGTVTGVN
jgi:hypothetical protein